VIRAKNGLSAVDNPQGFAFPMPSDVEPTPQSALPILGIGDTPGETPMRHQITIVVAMLCLTASGLMAQADRPPRPEQDRAARDDGPRRERPQDGAQSLTADQKAQVKAILSKYTASSLTATDARGAS